MVQIVVNDKEIIGGAVSSLIKDTEKDPREIHTGESSDRQSQELCWQRKLHFHKLLLYT